MRKAIHMVLGCLAFAACSKATKTESLQLSGEISGLKQGTLYAKTVKDSTLVVLDSAVLKGTSLYQMNLNITEPQVLYLTLDRGTSVSEDNAILFFAEPGKMKVNSSLTHFFADAEVEGAENQELYEKYLITKKKLTDRQNDLLKEQLLADKNGQKAKADSLGKQINRYQTRIYLNAVNFAVKNKDKAVAPYLALTEVAPMSSKYLDTIHNSLTPEIRKSLYGKILSEYVNPTAKKP